MWIQSSIYALRSTRRPPPPTLHTIPHSTLLHSTLPHSTLLHTPDYLTPHYTSHSPWPHYTSHSPWYTTRSPTAHRPHIHGPPTAHRPPTDGPSTVPPRRPDTCPPPHTQVDGSWSCGGGGRVSQLLLEELHGRMNFSGFVVTDWWATHSQSLATGLTPSHSYHTVITQCPHLPHVACWGWHSSHCICGVDRVCLQRQASGRRLAGSTWNSLAQRVVSNQATSPPRTSTEPVQTPTRWRRAF